MPSSIMPLPESVSYGHAQHAASAGGPRRVRVNARQGETATVTVTVVQGTVWMSIIPPFTWEAILEPGTVDEVIHVLEMAREEARKTARVSRENRAVPANGTRSLGSAERRQIRG